MRKNQKRKKPQGFVAAIFTRLPLVASVILGSLFLGYLFFKGNGLPLYLDMLDRQHELTNDTQQLAQSNESLRKEINQVQHNLSKLEQLARDQLGMVREDEVVYQFVEPNAKKSRSAP